MDPSASHMLLCAVQNSQAQCEFSWHVWISHGSFSSELSIAALEKAGVMFSLEEQLKITAGAIARYNEITVGCSARCDDGKCGYERRNFTTADPLGVSFVVTPLRGYLE